LTEIVSGPLRPAVVLVAVPVKVATVMSIGSPFAAVHVAVVVLTDVLA
jgi:hypothetical protein